MRKAFKEMESAFGEKELGLACLKLGLKLDQEGEDPEQTLSFATRALNALDKEDDSNKPSFPVAMALQLMGSANYSLKKFNDSLGYLNRANRTLGRLEEEGYNVADIRPVLHAVQLELANEALGFCTKALEIHKEQLGQNSVEVAHDRRLLGVIYTGLEEHEKALEQNMLSQKVLKNWGLSSDLLRAEIDAANMQIALGKYDDAINTLKGVVQQTDKESETRALVFISMGKHYVIRKKFSDAKRCWRLLVESLTRKRESPL
ncbi:hypothetical protein M0R45_010631 [Rubus argutus]|uniref:Uncharacterized protein n=1 Tax=Rubus argutus TaxID=59490 RepID=A0AAW1Y9C8_RUBAR